MMKPVVWKDTVTRTRFGVALFFEVRLVLHRFGSFHYLILFVSSTYSPSFFNLVPVLLSSIFSFALEFLHSFVFNSSIQLFIDDVLRPR